MLTNPNVQGLRVPTTGANIIVRCARCRIALTRPLRQLTDASFICQEDGQPFLPTGCWLVSDGTDYPADQLIANLLDLVNTALHPNPRRLNGCCGMDGCDGMNRVCANGHEVGTERSDCWWAHGIHFDPTRVVVAATGQE